MKKIFESRSDCPICISLDIFGDKWSFLVLRDIMLYGKHTYGEFLKMEEGISTNILADRLVALETAEIISKEVYPGSKSKFFYKLTRKGINLVPLAIEFVVWGGKYYEIKPNLKEVLRDFTADKEGFIKNLTAQLEKVTVPASVS